MVANMRFTPDAPRPFGKVLLDMSVSSDLGLKTPLVYRVVKLLKDHACLPSEGAHMAEVCFEEALVNAMLHGNGLNPAKTVHVQVCEDDKNWGVIFSDQGPGFKKDDIPDPEDDDLHIREGGRGIMLMVAFLDDIVYGRNGSSCMMVRHKQAVPDAGYLAAIEEEKKRLAAIPNEPAPVAVAAGAPTRVEVPDQIELDLGDAVMLVFDGEEGQGGGGAMATTGKPSQLTGAGPMVLGDFSGVRVIKLQTARLGEDNVHSLRDPLYQAVEGQRKVVLDLSSLGFTSSVGISMIGALNKRVLGAGGKLALAGTRVEVLDILKATGMGKFLRFEPDADTAVDKLKG